MAHTEQIDYFEWATAKFTDRVTTAANILEVGSQDINGTVRDFFPNAKNYLGLDIGSGQSVDLVVPGELIELPDAWADISISTECFEHAENWPQIFMNMIRITKPDGIIILTFAGKCRPTHGTIDSDLYSSPFTASYYRNLGPDDIAQQIAIGRYFSRHGFEVNSESFDTYFWGIRNQDLESQDVSTWESLEQRLVRAQGQLRQAVTVYNQLKAESEQARCESEQARYESEQARLEADQAKIEAQQARTERDMLSNLFHQPIWIIASKRIKAKCRRICTRFEKLLP